MYLYIVIFPQFNNPSWIRTILKIIFLSRLKLVVFEDADVFHCLALINTLSFSFTIYKASVIGFTRYQILHIPLSIQLAIKPLSIELGKTIHVDSKAVKLIATIQGPNIGIVQLLRVRELFDLDIGFWGVKDLYGPISVNCTIVFVTSLQNVHAHRVEMMIRNIA